MIPPKMAMTIATYVVYDMILELKHACMRQDPRYDWKIACDLGQCYEGCPRDSPIIYE